MKQVLLLFMALLLLASGAWAQAPTKFNYQGVARDAAGSPIANANISLRLSILDGSPAGVAQYVETQSATTNQFGLFNIQVGNGTAVTGTMTGIPWGTNDKYLKVEIDPAGGSSYVDLGATQLLSVPFALHSTHAESSDGTSAVSGTPGYVPKFIAANGIGNSQIIDNATNILIGTTTALPDVRVLVDNTSTSLNAIRAVQTVPAPISVVTPAAIYGESNAALGVVGVSGSQSGVYGYSTGALGGTVGVNTGTGRGIWGLATGTGVGGYFDGGTMGKGIIVVNGSSGFGTSTPQGRLVVMQPSTPVPAIDTFPAIHGFSYTPQGSKKGGVSGAYFGTNHGTGIHGLGYAGVPMTDVDAEFSTGLQDLGVYGSGFTAGVEGTSIGGIGVIGYNLNASFGAVTGEGNTFGIVGNAKSVGGAVTPPTRYGVYGAANGAATNWAGYFSGNAHVTGTLSKGAGTFKIDHPLDPENKYLYHSFVESPDMMNIYNGNVTTDANGYATVTLPGYFETLNKDFRYQLTVIGTFAQAIVAEKVNGNKFTIQTNQPNVEVSWQVTGIRHDKYAQAHPVVAEVEKEAELKGYYLHPEEWGVAESRGIDNKIKPGDRVPERNLDTSRQTKAEDGQAQQQASASRTGGVELIKNR